MKSINNPYQHYLSNPIAKPPCRMTNANMYGFFADLDSVKTQDFIDSTLNIAARAGVSFKLLGEFALITFTDIAKIASLAIPFNKQGWMQETDIIIWLPIAKVEKQSITYVYWYPAFISVNNIYALINGRETWGYNKYLCDYVMPKTVSELSSFSVSLECFKHFSPSSKLQVHELFSITPNSNNDNNSFLAKIEDFGDHVAHLFSSKKLGIDASLLKQLLNGFINPQMDQIIFKQFPNGDGASAVFQAVVHSPSKIKKIHTFRLLRPDFTLHVNKLDSFPLADMFGLKIGSQPLHLPFYIQMDFDQLAAINI